MTAAHIAEAIAALDAAASALNTGALTIPQQMAVAKRCYTAAYPLRKALEQIDVQVEAADVRVYEQYAYTLDSLADEPECEDPVARKRLLHACANGMRQAAGITR